MPLALQVFRALRIRYLLTYLRNWEKGKTAIDNPKIHRNAFVEEQEAKLSLE